MNEPYTVAEWVNALQRGGWKGRKVGQEHKGPCPRCGGHDRFHVKPGRVAVLASCRHGCPFTDLVRAVFSSRLPLQIPRRFLRPRPPGPRLVTGTPKEWNNPDFAALAEWIEDNAGLVAEDKLEARGLSPDRLHTAGWRGVGAGRAAWREVLAMADKYRVRFPAPLVRRCPEAWLVPVWDADGRPTSVRVRPVEHWAREPKAWTLKGDTARLYGADALHAPPGAMLHIAEGEMDAESLREVGETATMGTPGTTWRLEWTRGVVAAEPGRVVVWYDTDTAGQRSGARLAARLATKGLPVVRFTGSTVGSDVNDLLVAGVLDAALHDAHRVEVAA